MSDEQDDVFSTEDDGVYSLLIPFVVCKDKGGPYDAESFVAGLRYGIWDSLLKLKPTMHSNYEYPSLVPQLDLLAMHNGYKMTVESIDNGYVDENTEWVLVTMRRDV